MLGLLGALGRLRLVLISVMVTLALAPIAFVPYAGDDTFNRGWARLSWGGAIDEGLALMHAWMTNQGRFFPGSAFYTIAMWRIFDSRIAYALWVIILNLAILALVAFICLRLTRSRDVALIGVATAAACMQLRWWAADGLNGFGGLVPWTLMLTLVTAVGMAHVVRGGDRRWMIPVSIAWLLAITGYEVSLLMLPGILACLVLAFPGCPRARWLWSASPIILLATAQVVVSGILRSQASGLAPAYQTDLGGPVAATFARQFLAALPSAQHWLGVVPPEGSILTTATVLILAALAVPTFLAWRWRQPFDAADVPRRRSVSLIVAGAWAWVVPSALAAITVRWQEQLELGQGYIYLMYEYVGIALIVAGAASLVARPARPRWATFALILVFALAIVGVALTIASNVAFAGQFVPGPSDGF